MELSVKNLFFGYRGKEIFRSAEFCGTSAQIIAVLGENGSGKTTFLKLLAGFLTPKEGEILFDGSQKQPVLAGFFETPCAWNELTGRENAEYFLEKQYDRNRIEEAFEYWGIRDALDIPVHKYSLGMRQKLALIIAFSSNAPVLLFDEPTNALDFESIRKFYVKVKEAKEEGKLILFATHLVYELRNHCDAIYELKDKQLIPAKETVSDKQIYRISFASESDAEKAAELLGAAACEEICGREIHVKIEEQSISRIIRSLAQLDITEVTK